MGLGDAEGRRLANKALWCTHIGPPTGSPLCIPCVSSSTPGLARPSITVTGCANECQRSRGQRQLICLLISDRQDLPQCKSRPPLFPSPWKMAKMIAQPRSCDAVYCNSVCTHKFEVLTLSYFVPLLHYSSRGNAPFTQHMYLPVTLPIKPLNEARHKLTW